MLIAHAFTWRGPAQADARASLRARGPRGSRARPDVDLVGSGAQPLAHLRPKRAAVDPLEVVRAALRILADTTRLPAFAPSVGVAGQDMDLASLAGEQTGFE